MAHLLFAAHDPGGANMLLPVMALARDHGYRTSALGYGPAAAIWRGAGETIEAPETDDGQTLAAVLASLAPDLAVTATGTTGIERALWRAARGAGIPTLAAIDAWPNLRRRFTDAGGGLVQPDAVCAVDEPMRDAIAGDGWCRARLYVTGQPHLEAVVGRLDRARAAAGKTSAGATKHPLLAFVSEPLAEDYRDRDLGFDQYGVIDALVAGLAGLGPLTLVVQPHPRDDRMRLEGLLGRCMAPEGITVRLGDGDTEALLAACDGVIGMTSMVLIEAALAAIPALSLQPGRNRVANPGVDGTRGIRIADEPARVGPALAGFIAGLAVAGDDARSRPVDLDGAATRFLAAIGRELDFAAAGG
jgi:hypothetical protein